MGIELARAFVTVRADAKRLPADLTRIKARVTRAMSNIASIAKGLNKTLVAISTVAVTVGARQLISMANQRIELAKRQIDAEQRLAAVVKATGAAAGFQASQLQGFASQLQKSTTIGDEAILESMAILLTFRSITGDAFKETTRLALDMSAVMGNDAKGAVLQLGKALEDPITGLGALRRSGISFSEQQKEQIKGFVETNKLAKAQGIILKVVRDQLGGVAESLAETDAGKVKQLTNQLNDMREELGRKLLPLQREWLEMMIELQPAMAEIGLAVADFARELGPVVKDVLPDLIDIFKVLIPLGAKTIQVTLIPMKLLIAGLGEVFRGLAESIAFATDALRAFGLVEMDRSGGTASRPLSSFQRRIKAQAQDAAERDPSLTLKAGMPGAELTPFGSKSLQTLKSSRDSSKSKLTPFGFRTLPQQPPAPSLPSTPLSPSGPASIFSTMDMALAFANAFAQIKPEGLLDTGRSGFAELGVKIQDILIGRDEDALNKERNSLLAKQLEVSGQIVGAVQEQDKRLGLS